MTVFATEGNQFTYNGQSIRVLSGAIHYFRVVPEYWEDRLLKLKACGLNTVETYVPWNLHEPQEGRYVFEGIADLVGFIELAGRLGLHVIVRPSPYICAEWEFGGLPAWLLADPGIRLRCFDERYLEKVDRYYDALLPKLVPYLCTNGGPIIAMQIENEYGSYGNDIKYLEYLRDGMVRRGIDVLLFTSDGPEDFMLQGGMVPGVLETVNFGSRADEAFAQLRRYQPDGPLMVMEFWNGWFDHWGEEHHTRDAAEMAEALDDILRAGASVNFYMFHGGTNFGFWNGANHHLTYEPTVTSYDYDTLLSEWGEPMDKFYAAREAIGRYVELPELSLPEPLARTSYGTVRLTERADLFTALDKLSAPVRRACPEPMEAVGQGSGFILYSTRVSGPRRDNELVLQHVRDRVLVFVDGRYAGVVERWAPEADPIRFDIPAEGVRLDILVENMGRVNYGPLLKDHKGITEGVRLGNQFLYDWEIRPLPLDDLSALVFNGEQGQGPAFYRGTFAVEGQPADTFVALDGWTKGVVYVNGFNLGRYWSKGPQRRLYVPGPLLREGDNDIVVFELHGTNAAEVALLDSPDLGGSNR
ncbi:beta-galactosidase [Cohnella sp. CIP 111063]|uniref:glycoside hydrolase family 35 protein n=1 Tax=unclassified Cohnella TaxID=2636738 RepID=UPI000B8BEB3D|nr:MULTISPECIES: glycoside hydrolase family 35 protein [unclassified Cohnella]OXS55241.1 beta-galactosidase [Cohnella sp. CIP 111063]PRX65664.1 beta-galactosidase [Cohnella sp. SGD-V74]